MVCAFFLYNILIKFDIIQIQEFNLERIDNLLNGNKIFQDSDNFLFGIDAVLLADFVTKCCRKNDFIVDLCSGNAIIPLLIEKNLSEGKILGVEIQEKSANLAKKSVQINNLQEKINILQEDLKQIHNFVNKHSVDVVCCNPPYMIFEHGKQNPNDAKAIARHEVACNLEDVVACADYLLKTHGIFCMIHRPFRLPEIFETLHRHQLEPKKMQLIFPFEDKEPNLVLIEARKNANPRLKIDPPLIVREKSGEYTKRIKQIYSV